MRVLVLHDEPAVDARADEEDTLVQAAAVADALRARGHEVEACAVGLDLGALLAVLRRVRPDVAFHLVESIARSGRLAQVAALVLEHAGCPHTGSDAAALALVDDKVRAKAVLAAAGLPTPPWRTLADLERGAPVPGRWLVKARFEHGSLGIDDDAVLEGGDAAALAAALRARLPRVGGAGFLEQYVHGRECNVGLLEDDGAPRCLAVAEIRFRAAFAGRPHLLGYRAKWATDSADYADTVRSFAFAATDHGLVRRLEDLARAAWDAFGLSGYARIDFRVDAGGELWIIDVNANPCLTKDAGFAAMLAETGIAYGDALEHILLAALRRRDGR
ncbi:MAG TPA: D-alanine--D-alanine ligase [Planctomycetota bacterium]|nr:D-alanine--D-alanine ligase [Planctomycetota bacterium]